MDGVGEMAVDAIRELLESHPESVTYFEEQFEIEDHPDLKELIAEFILEVKPSSKMIEYLRMEHSWEDEDFEEYKGFKIWKNSQS